MLTLLCDLTLILHLTNGYLNFLKMQKRHQAVHLKKQKQTQNTRMQEIKFDLCSICVPPPSPMMKPIHNTAVCGSQCRSRHGCCYQLIYYMIDYKLR